MDTIRSFGHVICFAPYLDVYGVVALRQVVAASVARPLPFQASGTVRGPWLSMAVRFQHFIVNMRRPPLLREVHDRAED